MCVSHVLDIADIMDIIVELMKQDFCQIHVQTVTY